MAQCELLELGRRLLADDLRSNTFYRSLSLSICVAIDHELELSGDDERLPSLVYQDLVGALSMVTARFVAFYRSLDIDIEVLNLLCKLRRYSLLHRLDVALPDRRWLRDEGVTFVLLFNDC